MSENNYMTYVPYRRQPLSFCESETSIVRILNANRADADWFLKLWKRVNDDYIFIAEINLQYVPKDKKELEEFVAHLVKE